MRKSKDTEQMLDRALAILTGVVATARPVSVTDIAAACALPGPTAHRIVGQLERRGLLKRALGSKKVIAGEALLDLGLSALNATMRSDRTHQILVGLSAELGEHVQVGIRSDNEVLYVDSARSPRPAGGLQFEQGRRAPLYCTSIGKIYLAEMTDDEFSSWLAHTPLPEITPRTITSPARLRRAVAETKKAGWAVSADEFAVGVVGCAVPIRRGDGQLVAGLGISVPSARLAVGELAHFRPRMDAAARAISAALVG
jgi:IclR family transcriptional regulator, acetate operon repressor